MSRKNPSSALWAIRRHAIARPLPHGCEASPDLAEHGHNLRWRFGAPGRFVVHAWNRGEFRFVLGWNRSPKASPGAAESPLREMDLLHQSLSVRNSQSLLLPNIVDCGRTNVERGSALAGVPSQRRSTPYYLPHPWRYTADATTNLVAASNRLRPDKRAMPRRPMIHGGSLAEEQYPAPGHPS